MNAYSPFDKALQRLATADLAALREVSEGWYVEYKQELSNASSMAKSISAFGNTYGGWIFYGVSEKSKEEPVAGSFPGIARADVDVALQRMRQAVASHTMPSPHFETNVLWGPCRDIGLSDDRAVVCVRVPWSVSAPHIHKSGQIYRRVADGSEPRPENDRFVLDQLWQRSNDLRKKVSKWVARNPEFSEFEKSAVLAASTCSRSMGRSRALGRLFNR